MNIAPDVALLISARGIHWLLWTWYYCMTCPKWHEIHQSLSRRQTFCCTWEVQDSDQHSFSTPHAVACAVQLLCNIWYSTISHSFTDDPCLAQQHWQVYRGAQHKENGGGNGLMMMIPCWHDLLLMWWLQRWQYSCCCKKAKWVIRRPRRACLLASDSIRLMKS
jgi:hypothetical protein